MRVVLSFFLTSILCLAVSGCVQTRREPDLYQAGLDALHKEKDERKAYVYFSQCAEAGHAGCINIMASARMTGDAGYRIDVSESIRLHIKTYETGLAYSCAGPYSAGALARIVHFLGEQTEQGDEFFWLQRAIVLSEEFHLRYRTNRCSSAEYIIDEYLMRREMGSAQPHLLQTALVDASITPSQFIGARYLAGELEDNEFKKEVAKLENAYFRCNQHFIGLWNSVLLGRRCLAKSYHDILLAEPNRNACSDLLVYARKYFPS